MMFTPTARILADSVSEAGDRLTTFEATGHRFILSEMNTHRTMSRNSASSRAIPYAKMREKVMKNLAYPVSWPVEQKGMQGGSELGDDSRTDAMIEWWNAALSAIKHADKLHDIGLHKSVCNRLIEPFLSHTMIISATDYSGFFEQRCHPDAQPEIHALADAMKAAYDESNPFVLKQGEWHLPLIQEDEWPLYATDIELLKKLSVARCARVSYLSHSGVRDHEEDLTLYNRLRNHKPPHSSPLEHVATPGPRTGNFQGWSQLRHLEGLK